MYKKFLIACIWLAISLDAMDSKMREDQAVQEVMQGKNWIWMLKKRFVVKKDSFSFKLNPENKTLQICKNPVWNCERTLDLFDGHEVDGFVQQAPDVSRDMVDYWLAPQWCVQVQKNGEDERVITVQHLIESRKYKKG